MVERRDKLYFHYAVYVGNGRIIHYASDTGDWGEHIYIHEASLKEFTHDVPVIKICTFPEDSTLPGYHLYSAEETVERARSRLGEEKYDLFSTTVSILPSGARQIFPIAGRYRIFSGEQQLIRLFSSAKPNHTDLPFMI